MNENNSTYRPVAVRYQVKDTDRSIDFYTGHLGFKLDRKAGPVGLISSDGFQIWLSGRERPDPNRFRTAEFKAPGGWNRLALEVEDLPARIEELKKAGLHFRNEMLEGPGGKQIQLEDPDGNPIELFEWAEQSK